MSERLKLGDFNHVPSRESDVSPELWARRFKSRPGKRIDIFEAQRVLHDDPRWAALPTTARVALDHALLTWADADLRWQVKTQTWADAIGVAGRTLRDALTKLVDCGLLIRTPYHRPKGGGQGATIYRLEYVRQGGRWVAPLVATAGSSFSDKAGGEPPTLSERESADATRQAVDRPPYKAGGKSPALRNEFLNEKTLSDEGSELPAAEVVASS